MNNPAAKEPSMDEILSSIRQIIADEDDTGTPAQSTTDANVPSGVTPASESEADAAMLAAVPAPEPEPLALSPEQMIAKPGDTKEDVGGVAFDPEAQEAPIPAPPPESPELPAEIETSVLEQSVNEETAEPENDEEIALVVADDVAFDEAAAAGLEQPAASVSRSVPMPDADLSADMAENLLAPATDAATRHAFSKLGALSIGGGDLTLEAIVRDMLRPMLKEWLDENLPATVERMVEKEIERVSRGG